MKKWKTNGLSMQKHKCPQCGKVDRFKCYHSIKGKGNFGLGQNQYKYLCVPCGYETQNLDPKTIIMR